MLKPQTVTYHKDIDNRGYWLTERQHLRGSGIRYSFYGRIEKFGFADDRDVTFLPSKYMWMGRLIHIIGKKWLPDEWDGTEFSSQPIKLINGKVCERDLYKYGKKVRGSDGAFVYDRPSKIRAKKFLVEPLAVETAYKEANAHLRLKRVLDSLRNQLYLGTLKGYTDLVDPKEIAANDWAGEIWYWALHHKYTEIIDNELTTPESVRFEKEDYFVFFERDEVNSYLSRDTQKPADSSQILSPYIDMAIEITEKFEINKSNRVLTKILIEYLRENWRLELGEWSNSKALKISQLARWPEHEKGGNKKHG